ncbi:hypothetical protein BO99DRAFT_113117 [Aspergillus violaceofuscus CBS 115571]|uniref:Uncharacterized protein n=1 Tax=Aspergillus violaceofuscus (strain CBS 115571) TaxID=1450538 RepID=A0A2V5H9N5_ASPV1|nr:hypothetical protein BO99DRAFT_113117 [Aspergillus violaceofuscus CBS 115571]
MSRLFLFAQCHYSSGSKDSKQVTLPCQATYSVVSLTIERNHKAAEFGRNYVPAPAIVLNHRRLTWKGTIRRILCNWLRAWQPPTADWRGNRRWRSGIAIIQTHPRKEVSKWRLQVDYGGRDQDYQAARFSPGRFLLVVVDSCLSIRDNIGSEDSQIPDQLILGG